ncbi:oligopeptide transport system substrate-binding protein [Bisgaardia hudsonensis]|uniref:Oligopeptide transport system substrate-binding protein n=1 Tax=Bisgaardia hudsonensis TaxID=109472 RepID=A0A4R2MS70_9PAST|nr:ABC transporter substrate-binding protein [Bisgaardia hudsonensis]QLB13571.1 oligopeptide ABC transporter substrate-binding protein OppA [Bisgaardia hudsonensis]TCP11901.1 oligopeptide transport system substrate-binding protein [Bisgaardia hudsonensis]
MTNTTKKTLINIALASAFSIFSAQSAFTAEVPVGTVLAEKQELRINNGTDPTSIDPHKVEGVPESLVLRQLFETLVISDDKGHIIPGAAEKWEHSDDFKTWTFHLRKNGKWSNGEPVTAEDFVFGFQRLADPNTASPYASYLQYLKLLNASDVVAGKKPVTELGVKALDDHTLELTLSESVPYADKLTEHYVLSPVNKKIIEKFGDKWTDVNNIVGNGAFKLSNWIINEKLEMIPNEFYWNNEKTVLTNVTLYPISSSNTDVSRYRAGDLDITNHELPTELFSKLKSEYPNEVYTPPSLCTYQYEINHTKAPFNDVRVRKALSMAIDRNIIAEKVMAQGQQPAYAFTPSYINGGEKIAMPEWTKLSQAERNKKAVELLKEAGFDKANPLTINLLYNTSDNHKKIAIAASSIWKKNLNGVVDIKLENQEWKTYVDSRHQANYDIARAGWCADYNEATTFLTYYLSNSSNNTAFYKSAEYDALLKSVYQEETDEGRANVYAKLEKLLDEDAALIPIYYYVTPRMMKPYVKGFAVNHPAQNYYLKDVYLIKH